MFHQARSSFSMICANCDHVGVQIEVSENAPSSTPVLCAQCKYPRGTLGDLRALSDLDREGIEP